MANDSIVPVATTQFPYYDDFDETKNFHRFLFRPGRAVQARELTQLQTILQKQVERFGRHIFADGSIVIGGQISLYPSTTLNLKSQYSGSDITVADYIGQDIYNSSNTVRATVIAGQDVTTNANPYLAVKYLTGTEFAANDVIRTDDNTFAQLITTSNATSNGLSASVQDGVFFVNGFFVRNAGQTIVIDPHSTTAANVRVGLEITDEIITENDDTTLLDPALEASNYQAPGATRYKINLNLAKRSLTSTDDSKFIELLKLKEGVIQNIVKYPTYSEIEKTLARRTYDESGNYTVRPFKLTFADSTSNTTNVVATLSTGKAYVFGHEFETYAPTALEIPKARDTLSVQNYQLPVNYGNYVYVQNVKGLFDTSTMAVIDMHCVNVQSIVTTNTQTYTSTKIGTTKIKAIEYDSATNSADGNTYIYKLHVFYPVFTANTGNATGAITGTTNTINLAIGSSTTANAYDGVIIRLTAGTSSGDIRKIQSYNCNTQTVTVTQSFSATPDTSTQYSLDFSFKDVESFISADVPSSALLNVSANIALTSKANTLSNGDVNQSETQYDTMVFGLPDSPIRNNISDISYTYWKKFETQAFTSGYTQITAGTGEVFDSDVSSTYRQKNYIVIVKDNKTNPVGANNQLIPLTNKIITLSNSNKTANINVGMLYDFTANILAAVTVSVATARGKDLYYGNKTAFSNSASIVTIGTTSVYGVSTPSNNKVQAFIAYPNKIPGANDNLYVPDVKKIQAVYDLGTYSFTTWPGATDTTFVSVSATDITDRYTLSTGQKDNFYDYSAIILKPGYPAPTGNIVVCFDFYNHGDGPGFFDVDSYPAATTTAGYTDIPNFISPKDGSVTPLRDAIDFRPRRNPLQALTSNSLEKITVPYAGSKVTLDYQYYLPRKDSIILTEDKNFEVLQGISGIPPRGPKTPANAMKLYDISLPAYTFYPQNVNISYIENKRYTMRDIGVLESRISNLEYYVSLSLLEQDTNALSIKDAFGLERTKNGILVDSFKGHSVGDVLNSDYKCSIDYDATELRPPYYQSSIKLNHAPESTGATVVNKGGLVTLPFTEAPAIVQNAASFAVSVNDFLFARFIGNINLIPQSDIYPSTQLPPVVIVNDTGDDDVIIVDPPPPPEPPTPEEFIHDPHHGGPPRQPGEGRRDTGEVKTIPSWNTRFNHWEKNWHGRTTTDVKQGGTDSFNKTVTNTRRGFSPKTNDHHLTKAKGEGRRDVTSSTRTVEQGSSSTLQTRTPTSTTTITQENKGIVTDVNVVPYIRRQHIQFRGEKFRPSRRVFFFFDGKDVTNFIQRANEIVFTNGVKFRDNVGASETIHSTSNGTANVILTRGNTVYIVEATNSVFTAASTVTGNTSANTGIVSVYRHYSGTAKTGTTNSITLEQGASATNDYYNGNTVYITEGPGIGQSATISAYDGTTKVASLSSTLAVVPASNTKYSIGYPTTTSEGQICGTFCLPANPTTSFFTGDRTFRILDDGQNILTNSTTSGDVVFHSFGLIVDKTSSITSTRPVQPPQPDPPPPPTQDETSPPPTETPDPLSQTFFVSAGQYPNGLFLSSVDLFFKNKDASLPVSVELRPTVNGYPDRGNKIPMSDVTLYPEKVNISELPDSSNSATATRFTFDGPVYLAPGEYALVVASDSKEYECWISELGQLQIGTERRISTQPYLGSFFRSQNSSTWTAFQNQDLMFVLNRCVFSVGSGTAVFTNRTPAINVAMDLAYTATSELNFQGVTTVTYAFRSKANTTGSWESNYTDFIPNRNYFFDDDLGRRIVANTGLSYNLRATLTTTDDSVSPVIDDQRLNLVAIENIINNLGISNDNITIVNQGYYVYAGNNSTANIANAANIVVTASGGGGSGFSANVTPDAIVNGNITAINIINSGSGYTGNVLLTFSSVGTGPVVTTTATAFVNNEANKNGGLALAKYISRRVTLNSGFDSSDLRVYLTAYKPTGTEIYVYYKILSQDDTDRFADKGYNLMSQLTPSIVLSTASDDFIEYEYRANATSNAISYTTGGTTYTDFNTFAIKIVLTSTNTTIVPRVDNMRAIALPSA